MNLKTTLRLVLILLVASACAEKPEPRPSGSGPLQIGARIGEMQTKSLISASAETRISSVRFASYDASGVLEKTAIGDNDGIAVLNLSYGVAHTIAALANFDGTVEFPPTLTALAALTLPCPSLASMDSNGLPAAGTLSLPPNWDERGVAEVQLRRLVAKIEVTVDQNGITGGNPAGMTNLSMRMHAINGKLKPFATGGSKAETTDDLIDADSHCDRDMNLAPGSDTRQSVCFFVPENRQGTLLSGNQDPFLKTPEAAHNPCVTWLELQSSKNGGDDGVSGQLTYRICPGADALSSFDIEGNVRYLVTLSLSWDGMFVESWKVERSDWDDRRGIAIAEDPAGSAVNAYELPIGTPSDLYVVFSRTGTPVTGARALTSYPYGWQLVLPGHPEGTGAVAGTVEDFSVSWDFDDTGDRIRLNASSEADIDRSFPIRVETIDGHKYWETLVTVVARPLGHSWDRAPQYIAQAGTLTVTDLVDGADPSLLSFTAEQGADLVRITNRGDGTADVAAVGDGTVRIRMESSQTRQRGYVDLTVRKPVLTLSDDALELFYDGETATRSIGYCDENGLSFSVSSYRALRSFDPTLYAELLQPEADESALSPFARASVTTSPYSPALQGEIWRFTDSNGARIPENENVRTLAMGSVRVHAKTASCSNEVVVPVEGVQPFYGNDPSRNFGKADDYSLLGSAFNGRSSSLSFESHPLHIGTRVTPEYRAWSAVHNNADNSSLTVTFQNAAVNLSFSDNGSTSAHLGGVNTISVSLRNYHSPSDAPLTRDIGVIEVYVHAAIGLYMAPSGSDWEDLSMDVSAAQWAFYCSPYFLNINRVKSQAAFSSIVSSIENRSSSPLVFEFNWLGGTDATTWLSNWDMDPGGGKTGWRAVTNNDNPSCSWDPTGKGFLVELSSAYVNLNSSEKTYYNLHGGALIAAGYQFKTFTSKSTRLESYNKLRAATGLPRKIYAPFRMLRAGSGAPIRYGSSYDIKYPASYQDSSGEGYYRISYLVDDAPETNGWIRSLSGSDRFSSTVTWNPNAHN